MLTMAKAKVALSLPRMICAREAGLISSGSSDWRSRSPAVASMARYMPPRNTLRISR